MNKGATESRLTQAEEIRIKHAQAAAKAARDQELARRAAVKKAQASASKDVHRPLVTSA